MNGTFTYDRVLLRAPALINKARECTGSVYATRKKVIEDQVKELNRLRAEVGEPELKMARRSYKK